MATPLLKGREQGRCHFLTESDEAGADPPRGGNQLVELGRTERQPRRAVLVGDLQQHNALVFLVHVEVHGADLGLALRVHNPHRLAHLRHAHSLATLVY